MKIRLIAFATASDALGREEITLELPDGSHLGDLKRLLTAQHASLVPLWPRLAVAIDGEIAGEGAVLREGNEVALLPPVSGGTDAPRAHLTNEPIDVAAVEAAVTAPQNGAVVLFIGTVRNHHRGNAVQALTYSAYDSMAVARMERICRDLEAETPGLRVAITHRQGHLQPTEASVVIAVSSPHRAAAYEASRTALERLKKEVPIWKREHYADGTESWREEEGLVGGAETTLAP